MVSVTHRLDTSWIIRHLRGAAAYTQTIRNIGAPRLAVSVVSLAELYEGVFRTSRRADAERALALALTGITILPIDDPICRLFGEHRARLRQSNQLIGDVDLLIAATCLHHALPLLTTNTAHFQRIPGLTIISTPF
jgi:tRNA(fMet)-specific endonuclease VapC